MFACFSRKPQKVFIFLQDKSEDFSEMTVLLLDKNNWRKPQLTKQLRKTRPLKYKRKIIAYGLCLLFRLPSCFCHFVRRLYNKTKHGQRLISDKQHGSKNFDCTLRQFNTSEMIQSMSFPTVSRSYQLSGLYKPSLYSASKTNFKLTLNLGASTLASEGDFHERDSNRNSVEVRLSGHQLSRLFDYPAFFSRPVFVMNINEQNFKTKKFIDS